MARRLVEISEPVWMAVKFHAALRGLPIYRFLDEVLRRELTPPKKTKDVTPDQENP